MKRTALSSAKKFASIRQSGFTLVEMMIAITIGLILMVALISILVNINRANTNLARTNNLIENGRFAIQILQSDVQHAGHWGAYVPQFDNLSYYGVPTDVPNAVPDPCLAYASWTTTHKNNLIGINIQPVPSGNCTSILSSQKANTDSLVVRHAELCVPGVGNCPANVTGALYFQPSLCSAVAQLGGSATTIKLAAGSSSVNNYYNGRTIRLTLGTGAGQSRTITAYNGSTKVATVNAVWVTTPDSSTNYSLDATDYVLGTSSALTLTKRDCSTVSDTRKFVSNIYYIRDYASTSGDGIPTLMRSQFDLNGGTLAHQTATPLVEGIEGFRVEYGIDSVSDSGVAITNATHVAAVSWSSLSNQTSPTNRGDGNADGSFVRCPPADQTAVSTSTVNTPAATACTFTQLTDAVEAKIYILARNKDTTPGHTDTKTYALGSTTLGPFNDGYERHVFSTTVRLTNVSGRRETP